MKLTPIKFNTTTYKKTSNNNCQINKNRTITSDMFFTGSWNESQRKINSDVQAIKNSQKFKSDMTSLRRDSLNKKKSLDDFLIASMYVYIKNAINFPIKEDFLNTK